jgi:outer membrane murein-binding lipoprotein Lpp
MTDGVLRLAAAVVCIGVVAGCSQTSREESFDSAAEDARHQVSDLQEAVGGILKSSSSAAEAEERFGSGNRMVLASSTTGRGVHWDVAVAGTGTSGDGVGTLTLSVLACLRLSGEFGSSEVDVADIPCPSGIDNRNGIGGYDKIVELFD